MADNTQLNVASDPGDTFVTIDIGGGVKIPVSLLYSGSPPALVSIPNSLPVGGGMDSSFHPDPWNRDINVLDHVHLDYQGNVRTRGPVFTDEESLRDDFKGTSLTTALTGTLTFTNGLTTVTGTGTLFTSEVNNQSYIKPTAASETTYSRAYTIDSDTQITLAAPYTGPTVTGVAAVSSWWVTKTPAGGAITVTSSLVNLTNSTANAAIVAISRTGDYLPFSLTAYVSISQRIANQRACVGFEDVVGAASQAAEVVFDGTDNTKVKFRTSNGSAAADTEETVVSMPLGVNTSQSVRYDINVAADQATLTINGIPAATHNIHLPGPYTVCDVALYVQNTGVAGSATTLSANALYFSNVDVVNVDRVQRGQPMAVTIAPPLAPGNVFGDISLTSANTTGAIRRTAYTEQTTNFTGSIISSSANDASAGTGARTLRIIYLDSTGRGPFTELVTMNGLTSVPLTATDKCYIQQIELLTVGSTGAAVGTITLRNNAVATVWTIAAGDTQTFAAHHYVPLGNTCTITSVAHGNSSVAINSGSSMALRALPLTVANAVERQITGTITVGGAATQATRTFGSPPQVAGPARITAYVTTISASTIIYRGAFDFYEV